MSEERARMVIGDDLVNIECFRSLWNDPAHALIDEWHSAKANTAKSMTETLPKEIPDADKSYIELCAQESIRQNDNLANRQCCHVYRVEK